MNFHHLATAELEDAIAHRTEFLESCPTVGAWAIKMTNQYRRDLPELRSVLEARNARYASPQIILK